MVVLLEVGRRYFGVAATQCLVADWFVATGRLDVEWHYLLLLLDRQGEKLVRFAVEVAHHIGPHAMSRNGKEPDLGADAIDPSAHAQARVRIAGERTGEIDDGDFGLHYLNSRSRHGGHDLPNSPNTEELHR